MSKQSRCVLIQCDKPGCKSLELIDMQRAGRYWTDERADDAVRALGWYVSGGVHFCPKHHPETVNCLLKDPSNRANIDLDSGIYVNHQTI